MNGWGQGPGEKRYFGLTAVQFNLAFFAVVGSIAVAALIYFGVASEVGDLWNDDAPSPVVAAPTPMSASPTPTSQPEPTATSEPVPPEGGEASPLEETLGLDPLVVLDGLGLGPHSPPQPDSANVSGPLEATLLVESDLPAGFVPLGDMTFSLPDDELGSLEMAARMFGTPDIEAGQPGTVVMSAALAAPAEAWTQLNGSDALDELDPAGLDEISKALEDTGIVLHDLRLLDASGLGEGGIGIHMEVDFSQLLGSFPGLADGNPFSNGIAWDMYMFLSGDRMLMLMVAWPPDLPSGVDARALAEIMDVRASQR